MDRRTGGSPKPCRIRQELIDRVLGWNAEEALRRTASVLEDSLHTAVVARWAAAPIPADGPGSEGRDEGPKALMLRDPDGRAVATIEVQVGDPETAADLDDVSSALERVLAHAAGDDALRRREERFRSLIEQAAEAIVSVGSDGRICYANRAAVRIFGYTEGELQGMPATRLLQGRLSKLRPASVPAVMRREARRLDGSPTDIAGRGKDGRKITLATTITIHRRRDDWECTASMRDVTEGAQARAATDRALRIERRSTRHLRSVDEMRRNLLGAVYHELVEPLSVIRGLSAVLSDPEWKTSGDRSTDSALQQLHDASEQMARLLSDLLDLYRFDAGRSPLIREEVDVGNLVWDVVKEPRFKGERVDVRAHPIVQAVDPALVRTIIRNLIKNAVRHSPPDGRVIVTVERHARGTVIAVTDRGPGIPRGDRRAVFEPFWRGKDTAAPGLGLGLSVVAAFAKAHGGRVSVDEPDGGGASFSVFLPRPSGL
jgi:PAS domain S-box-containing protein